MLTTKQASVGKRYIFDNEMLFYLNFTYQISCKISILEFIMVQYRSNISIYADSIKNDGIIVELRESWSTRFKRKFLAGFRCSLSGWEKISGLGNKPICYRSQLMCWFRAALKNRGKPPNKALLLNSYNYLQLVNDP